MAVLKKSQERWTLCVRSHSAVLTNLLLVILMMLCTASAVSNTKSEQVNRDDGFSLEPPLAWPQTETNRIKKQGDDFKITIHTTGQTLTTVDSINLTSAREGIASNVTLSSNKIQIAYSDVAGSNLNNFIVVYTTNTDSHWSTLSTTNFLKIPRDIIQLNSNETTVECIAIIVANNSNYNAEDSPFTSPATLLIQQEQPLVSSYVRITISRYYALVVNPIIGIIGLVTNAISGIVIIRSGLRKPSNIFLLALAGSDWICMIRNVNIAWLLTYLRDKMPLRFIGWEMSFWDAYVCYIIDKIIVRISNFAAGMSTAVTVLIILERLLATFIPLRFSSILTPFRAWVVLASTVTCLLPPYMFKIFLEEFRYAYYPAFNSSMGTFGNSAFYNSSSTAVKIFNLYFIIHFEFTLPLAIVLIGSVLLSIKITSFRKKRQAMIRGMSASTRQTIRTTTTLLMVCLLFSFTRIAYLFVYLPIFDDTKILTRNVSVIFVDVRWSLVQVNSACNIVVYVLFNPKFKRILTSMFVSKMGRCSSMR